MIKSTILHEMRCQGTKDDGTPCGALLGTFTNLEGIAIIVCRRCRHRNIFIHKIYSGKQYTNGTIPKTRVEEIEYKWGNVVIATDKG
jgi:hypothetical protein